MKVEGGSYRRSRHVLLSVQSFPKWLTVRSSGSEEEGFGGAGLVHRSCCDSRALPQSVVFMHLTVVRACMEECTEGKLGLRGGISEHC